MSFQLDSKLIECVEEELKPHLFQRMAETPNLPGVNIAAVWKRRNFNTNRAVALLPFSDVGQSPGQFAQSIKVPLGKAIGYIPVLNELGLQMIIAGPELLAWSANLNGFLDKINNQRVILQSLHIVDLTARHSVSARTWGQVITGRYQDAIENGIKAFLRT
ncbi:MAG TPA: hypothetical protein VJX74_01425 [Blastocatellia bacterium]|nr:hypothetical protein [Blastocatellia bacterium]